MQKETNKKPARRAMDLMLRSHWAMLPDTLETMKSIALRDNESPEAVAAKLGRPLQNAQNVTVRDGIAIIPVSGPIFRHANLFTEISGATSIDNLALDLNKAINDKSIKSIILEIDSPGGEVSGTSEFSEMVANCPKHTTAYISNLGASAAYWIASAADNVVIRDTGMAGSIGVVTSFTVDENSSQSEIVSSQSPKKRLDMNSEEGRSEVQKMVDSLADVFVGSVAKNMGVSTEKVLSDFGKGGIFVGQEAVEAGLANEVGSLEGIIARLSGNGGIKPAGYMPAPDANFKNVGNDDTTEGIQMSVNKDSSKQAVSEFIAKDHPAVADELRKEGAQAAHDEAFKAGADAERARINAVEEQAVSGCEELINTLKADGQTTGEQAAVQVLQQIKAQGANTLEALRNEGSDPVAPVVGNYLGGEASFDKSRPVEERCKDAYDASADLRNEFSSLASYTAYIKASEKGQARVFNGGKK